MRSAPQLAPAPQKVSRDQPFRIDTAIVLQAERRWQSLRVEGGRQSHEGRAVLKAKQNRLAKIEHELMRFLQRNSARGASSCP